MGNGATGSGQILVFRTWNDPRAALKEYLREKVDLQPERQPGLRRDERLASESFPPLQCCRKDAGKARVPVTGKTAPRPEVGRSRLPRLQDRLCGLPIVPKARVLCNDRSQLLELDAAMS